MNPEHTGSDAILSESGLIKKYGFESRITFGWDLCVAGGLYSPSAV